MTQGTTHHFDVPRDFDHFRVEIEPDPEIECDSFQMKDGDVVYDATVTLDRVETIYGGKWYVELNPDGTVELDVTVMYAAPSPDGCDYERAVDTTMTLHQGDEIWLYLRAGRSTVGIER